MTQIVNNKFSSFRGIKAYLELELSQPHIPPHRSFAQLAFLRNGNKLYFRAFSALTPRYFTLISKEGTFWLEIPKAKTVYTGPLEAIGQENFELKVSPQDFQKLIIPNPIETPADNIHVIEQPLYWIVSIHTPIVGVQGTSRSPKQRELWIQKQGFEIIKEIRYSVNETPFLEIGWGEFEKSNDGRTFPHLITLFKPQTGYQLRLRLKKLEATDNIPQELFELRDLEGFKVERISV